jgi:hypothetical protein
VIFQGRRKTGHLDLEAIEMAVRSAMHQAGAAALTELLRFPAAEDDQRGIPCSCGKQAQLRGHVEPINGRKRVSRSRSGQNPRPVSTSSLGSPHYFDYQGFRDAIRPQNTTQIPQFPQKDRERNTRGIRDLLAITR